MNLTDELLSAAKMENISQMEYLLEKKVRVSDQDTKKDSKLHSEIYNIFHQGNSEVVASLLQAVNINGENSDKETYLHQAAYKGHDKTVALLLNQGAKLDIQDQFGSTALHHAAYHGHQAIVQLLLKQKITLDIQNKVGRTPLNEAARQGHEEIVALLLNEGASFENKQAAELIPAQDTQPEKSSYQTVFKWYHKALALLSNTKSPNPSVQEYYTRLESRLGYWLFLGNARHCGFWEKETVWPFPIGKAQRAMEKKLYERLALPSGSKVLDAGAGSGIVALFMAKRGLQIQAIDLTPIHVKQAKHNIQAAGLDDLVSIELGDYHNLSSLKDSSLDGAYTMETFVHADDPAKVLRNFYRLLKPGGVLVLHEADFHWDSEMLQKVLRLSHCQNTLKEGAYEELLKEAGFKDINVEDLTRNALPLWRFFGILAAVPYKIFQLLGVQDRFVNVMVGAEAYRNREQGRYISVRAVKPS